MEAASEAQLASMGLRAQRKDIDEIISFSQWDRKVALHRAIKLQNVPARPSVDNMWRQEQGNRAGYNTKCNVGICIINISAAVPGEGTTCAPKDLPGQSYLCKEEMGVWSKKYLTSSAGPTKYNQHLKQASDMERYSIEDYCNYVPNVVWDAVNTYKNLYLAKYIGQNSTLDITMMQHTFSSFKCGYVMDKEGIIDQHLRQVHGIKGIQALTPAQEIVVDTAKPFDCTDLLDLEISGPNKRANKLLSLFNRAVSSKVISNTTNRKNADLFGHRSQEFLK